MRTIETLEHLMDAALGKVDLDLTVRGGSYLDVYRQEWVRGDIGVAAGRIVSVGENGEFRAQQEIDATGKWIVPGFFDPHFHAGGCHLSPTRLAEAFLARGTTSTVCDFQEHYVVGGVEAARFALDEARKAGLRVYYLVPIHMFVVDELGVAGRPMKVEDMLEMLGWPETVAINEPPPGPVLGKDREALEVIAQTLAMGKVYAGHAPEFRGRMLQAYLVTGATSDHETTKAADAWMKLGLGMKPFMRQGSAAPDMLNLIELARDHREALRHMMMATDEVDPVDLAALGHMDYKVRLAIEKGVDPIGAYQMVTLNPAEYYRVDHDVGSLTPGRFADMVILSDPEKVEIEAVIAEGRIVTGPNGHEKPSDVSYPESVISKANLSRPLVGTDFRLDAHAEATRVRVVGIHDASLMSTAETAEIRTIEGAVPIDPSRDLLKMAVIDSFTGENQMGITFVRGFGFREGAVATTYAHPFYNILVVGVDEESMALAANDVASMGGGITVVRGGRVVSQWRLPIVGIFSTDPLEVVNQQFTAMNESLRQLGCDLKSPVLALSFAPVPTIPAYGLTSKGLYDVEAGQFVSPFVDVPPQ